MSRTASRQSSRQVIGRLVRLSPSAYAYVTVAAALATIPGIAVPLLLRVFVDQYLVAANTSWAAPIVVGLVVALVVTAGLKYLQYLVLARLSVRLSASESVRFVWHVLRLPVTTIQRFSTGDLTARAAAIQRQSYLAGLLVPMAMANVVTILIYTAVVLALDLALGLAGVAVVIGSMGVSTLLLRRRRTLQTRADNASVRLSASTTEAVSAAETIKAAAWEQWTFDRWSQHRAQKASATSALASDAQRLGLLPQLTSTIGLGVVLAVGSLLVFAGQLSMGTLVASQAMILAILVTAGQLVWIRTLIASEDSVHRQVQAVRVEPLDIEVLDEEGRDLPGDRSLGLDFRDVTFGYDPDAVPLLDGLSVGVHAGGWLAVVGPSGSGKSTLARLAVGELQPWSGQVLIDGVPRLGIERLHRTGRVGYVPQYPVLMPGTIAENITMFDDAVPIEVIRRALRDAQVIEAVDARPGGLEERVSVTGHGFSGGELQRLAIARALVRDPGLLILDEATSALDPIVEVTVMDAIRARGCTCLIVAHRLSTVRDADAIIVVEGGAIVQQGSFDTLRTEGRFAELAHG